MERTLTRLLMSPPVTGEGTVLSVKNRSHDVKMYRVNVR